MTRILPLVLGLVLALTAPLRAAELVMVEERGCIYCATWNAQVGPIYPKTAEGKYAPLRRVDVHGDGLDGIRLRSRVVYTPTFLIVEDGRELARIEGYPGEEFFWWVLARMLNDYTDFAGAGS